MCLARLPRERLRLRGRPCEGSRVRLPCERLWLLSLLILPLRALLRRMRRPRRFSLWSGLESWKGVHDSDRIVAGEQSLCLRSTLLTSRRMFRVDTMMPERFVGGAVRRVAATTAVKNKTHESRAARMFPYLLACILVLPCTTGICDLFDHEITGLPQ